ncbi:alpha/beta hydrolase [Erythrobacter sp.]|jgi:dienelactone hydrolase|uniref:alpha/beta hydrolase n=1 Tax=Erythrobacter sp. TaxID=1042 RepID=UPI002EB7F726|nr:acyl-CoA thioester hydrolase/BAAT C-terminal domain-containing protein [Erythrobacter sp.]
MLIRSILCSAALGLSAFAPINDLAASTADTALAEEIGAGDDLPGSFFIKPAGEGPHPAIIVMGGSEGNDASARRMSELFTQQGYAVFGLIYYSPKYWGASEAKFPQLPSAFASIPVEGAERALNWLREREDVRADAIGLYGVSKGAEYALLAGSKIEGFAAIAAIVPSDVVWEGWGSSAEAGTSSSFSWRGEPLAFVPYIKMQEEIAKYGTDETPRLRTPQDAGRHHAPGRVPAARIRVETIDEPVLVAGGDQDDVWASGEMAQAIAERRAEAGRETVSLIFPDAGHALSGDPTPNDWSSEADVEARKVIWPATLDFFAAHLKD